MKRIKSRAADLRAAAFLPGRKPDFDQILLVGLSSKPTLTLSLTDVIARLVTAKDGGPIRQIITGRRVISTGSYPSRKAERQQVYESIHEKEFFMECEVDPTVIDYRAQPFRLDFDLDGQARSYIPDCARLMCDGSVEIVEVKADFRSLHDPDYAAKLSKVRELIASRGWTLRARVGAVARRAKIWHANVDQVQQRRMTFFDYSDVYLAHRCICESGGSSSLADVARALGGLQIGAAKVMAMCVTRYLMIDLESPIGPDSRVQATSETFARKGMAR